MAKKKKKTLASTRKENKPENQAAAEKKLSHEKGLKNLLLKKKKMSRAEKRAAERAAEKMLQSFEKSAQETVEKAHKKEKKKLPKMAMPKMPKLPRLPKLPAMAPQRKQKIRGGILAGIGLFALAFMGWFLFGKMFRPAYLAELLPAGKTVAILEVNVDFATGQPKQFFETLKQYAVYQPEGVLQALNTVFPVNYTDQVQPWLGRRAGVAFYAMTSESGSTIEPALLIESKQHDLTLEFLQNRGLKSFNGETIASDVNGIKIYQTVAGDMAYMFLENYLVTAQSLELLRDMAQESTSQTPRLASDESYRKVANNLPQGGLVFGYMSTRTLFEMLGKNQIFTAQKGQDFLAFEPFLDLFPAEGFTLFAENGRFTGQMFTVVAKDNLDGAGFLTFSEKYEGKLLPWANEEPVLVAGGHDLTKEIKRLEEVFTSGTKTSSMVFNGMLEAQKQRYFGKDTDLQEDVLPLLTREYLVTVENSFEEPVVTLFLELPQESQSTERLDELVKNFVQTSGVFTPRIQEVVLPDGTVGREVVASPEEIMADSETYNGVDIDVLKIGDTELNIRVAVLDGVAIFSSGQQALQRIIDRHAGNVSTGLATGKSYESGIRTLMKAADEIVHIKMGALTQVLGLSASELLQPYLVPFTNISVSRNYFEDGISTIFTVDVLS